MTHLERIDRVKSDLLSNGYKQEADELELRMVAASTGTEFLMGTVALLHRFKEESPAVYNLIKFDTDELIKFCNSIGIEFYGKNKPSL